LEKSSDVAHFSREKQAISLQISARGARWAGVRSAMTEGERIVLGDEGEGESEDSDPIFVTEEAIIGGNAGVSAGPSGFSNATVAPGSTGAFGVTPADPQASNGMILNHRLGSVKAINRDLAQITLETMKSTPEDIRGAVKLMRGAMMRGDNRRVDQLVRLEAWLAK
jgi:hypothetical protein